MITILSYLLLLTFFGLILFLWSLNFLSLPGNWLMIGAAALWIWLGPEQFQFSWIVLIGLSVLAIVGEGVEFAASIIGAKKMGGSSRGATLSVVGSLIGGILGVVIGIPIPIPLVGMLISGMLCASIGAMVGAIAGEYSLGTNAEQTAKIGGAAFLGRMLGTFGKIILGAAMVAVIFISPVFL